MRSDFSGADLTAANPMQRAALAGAAAAAHKRFGAVKTLDWAGFACPVHPNHGVPAKVPLLRGSPEG